MPSSRTFYDFLQTLLYIILQYGNKTLCILFVLYTSCLTAEFFQKFLLNYKWKCTSMYIWVCIQNMQYDYNSYIVLQRVLFYWLIYLESSWMSILSSVIDLNSYIVNHTIICLNILQKKVYVQFKCSECIFTWFWNCEVTVHVHFVFWWVVYKFYSKKVKQFIFLKWYERIRDSKVDKICFMSETRASVKFSIHVLYQFWVSFLIVIHKMEILTLNFY